MRKFPRDNVLVAVAELGKDRMSAPGGLCGSCQSPMQWTGAHDGLLVRCKYCADLFEFDPGTEVAGVKHQEGVDGETGPMPESWWSSVLAECEGSCRMQEVE